jgi:DNA-binding transcriptional ArsR family regulator
LNKTRLSRSSKARYSGRVRARRSTEPTVITRSVRTRRPPGRPRRDLEELQRLKLLAHPLRLRLLELFGLGPATTKQAAERLGEPPTRLYHHVYAMERAGLLRLTATRPNRGTVEKYFEAVKHRFGFTPRHLSRGRSSGSGWSAVAATADTLVDALRDDLSGMTPAAASAVAPIFVRALIHADRAKIRAIRAELVALVHRLSERSGKTRAGADTRRYALTLALLRSDSGAPTPAPRPAGARRRSSSTRES